MQQGISESNTEDLELSKSRSGCDLEDKGLEHGTAVFDCLVCSQVHVHQHLPLCILGDVVNDLHQARHLGVEGCSCRAYAQDLEPGLTATAVIAAYGV